MRPRLSRCPRAALALATLSAAGASALVNPETAALPSSQLVTRANTLLATGLGSQALELFDLVVERDPADYLSLYKRATAHLILSQTKRALEDFEAVLKLTEFDQARLQIARIHLKTGALAEARQAVDVFLKAHKKDADATALKASIGESEGHHSAAQKARKAKRWPDCVASATSALEISPNSLDLRELRADCHLQQGYLEEAVGDLSRAAALAPSLQRIMLQLSRLSYLYLGQDGPQALQPVKQCLHYDPDSKPCKALFRQLKTFEKDRAKARNFIEAGSWRPAASVLAGKDGLVQRLRDALATEKDLPDAKQSALLTTLLGWTCRAQVRAGDIRAAAAVCEDLLGRDPESIDGLVGRGEEALRKEDFDGAVRSLNDAFEKGGRADRDVMDRLQKAQKRLKQSKVKDYYKVLGVSRDADDRTIKKAYRRATLKAHPDKVGGSEKAMADVNAAYEVLSKPELRERYDNGDDPNDPASAQQQQHNPFAHHGGGQHFFFQQSGFQGGQQFKFHFG